MALIQVHHTGATEQFIRQGRQLTSAAVPTRQGSETRESGLVGQVLRAMVRMLNGLLATDVEGDAVTVSLAFHRHPGGSARVIHLDDERARHNQH